MPELTVAELAALSTRDYVDQVKNRLRDDREWATLLDPALEERTRSGLSTMIESLDVQVARAVDRDEADPAWLGSVGRLRRYAKARLVKMAPKEIAGPSSTNESRAWRAFSDRLARRLAEAEPEGLQEVWTPYGGMTAAQWLIVRDAKREEK